ncbi:Longitudinals lacking protein, isoforms A/B/D/L [Anthophora retusa]
MFVLIVVLFSGGYYFPGVCTNPYFVVPTKRFLCPNYCGSSFTHRGSLTRHLRYECQQNPRFKCPCCEFRSRWTSDVYKHVRKKHQGCLVRCIDIGKH